MRLRVLAVGFGQSIHVARWLSNLDGIGWNVHLFPVSFHEGSPVVLAPELVGVTVWDHEECLQSVPSRDVLVRRAPFPRPRPLRWLGLRATTPAERLAEVIRMVRPDVLHSMEFQHCGYLAEQAMRLLPPAERPPFIASDYGPDISFFGHYPEHKPRIRALLEMADVHHCECARDVALGREFGFRGVDAPVFSMGGGWDLDALLVHRTPGPTSARTTIALKGYEHVAGRNGVALEALRRCGRRLAGRTLEVYAPSASLAARARDLEAETGLDVRVFEGHVPYEEILALHGRARCSIGLSITDGNSLSMLEAMTMGSLPVQSWTGCGNEWFEDGVSGLLVPPEDPGPVAEAIMRAMTDDALVDRAASINAATVRARLDRNTVRRQVLDLYRSAANSQERCA